MANQQRFDGQDLEAVLTEVRAALGEDARIISADRIRKGGVGGFFAREAFEVVAERAEVVASATWAASPVDAALDWIETTEASNEPILRPGGAPIDALIADRAESAMADRPRPATPRDGLLDLAEAVNEIERERAALRAAGAAIARSTPTSSAADDALPHDLSPPSNTVSTETPTFASILARLSDDTDLPSEPAGADGASGAPLTFADALQRNRSDERGSGTSNARPAPAVFAIAEVDDFARAVLDIDAIDIDSVDLDQYEVEHSHREVTFGGFDDEDDEQLDPLEPVIQAFVPPRIERSMIGVVPSPATEAAPSPINSPLPAPITAVVELVERAPAATPINIDPDPVLDRPEVALRRLGIPARHVPRGVHPSNLTDALEAAFESLPSPPALPDTRGVVVAIIGARSFDLARTLAPTWGVDPQSIVFATPEPPRDAPEWLVITDAESARERRFAWQRRAQPTIVVIDAPRGNQRTDAMSSAHGSVARADSGWIRELLERLEPTQTWMLIDARAKSDDTAATIGQVGGVDVLAVNHLDATVSPASALELGLPIGRIDNRAATPAAWALYLSGRLESITQPLVGSSA